MSIKNSLGYISEAILVVFGSSLMVNFNAKTKLFHIPRYRVSILTIDLLIEEKLNIQYEIFSYNGHILHLFQKPQIVNHFI